MVKHQDNQRGAEVYRECLWLVVEGYWTWREDQGDDLGTAAHLAVEFIRQIGL